MSITSTTSIISCNPSSWFPGIHSRKHNNYLKPNLFAANIPASKPFFPGGFVPKIVATNRKRVWGPIIMNDLIQTSALRNTDDGDEGVHALEQEALINGSSKFPSKFVGYNLESTLNRLSKWLVSGFFVAVILWRHDAEASWIVTGSIINAILSLALKRILKQERPVSAISSGHGMPSSHAQGIFYTVVVIIFSILEWLGFNTVTVTISGLSLAFGSYLSWLRVSQQYHTASQVVIGALVGSIFSILWYWSWKALVQEAFNSSLWVQIFVISASVGFYVGFLVYVVRHWLKDES
ncbi:lipid phosphate phosphatase epsilon 2, chloroplastic-like [Quillaja saponaria]|uniref:Lipid phosphate phosphatase epsilon 2, chloroplastic-like n=1 Tax=Quillaja saponaria TaxID=32244 RepID=A0AAD7PFC8_QUISA|nr:lipid phosphate phosphatase epsilon 2, chloroplastic-like [Quillaja saponaria]